MTRVAPLLLAGILGCSEYDVRDGPGGDLGPAPDIVVVPESLEFGRLATGEVEVQSFVVRNVGEGLLHVSDVVVGAGIAFSVESTVLQFDLLPGEERAVEVGFTPMGADENFGEILVLSDDPDTPEAPVSVLGYGAVPDLVISPGSHNFGEAFVPCGDTVDLILENVGSEELVITELDYRSGGQLTIPLEAIRAQLPVILGPGETTLITVTYAAITAGADTGILEVTSNDPGGVETADQNGEGAYYDENTDQFDQPDAPAVDIVFLIDQSCSMDQEIDEFTAGIPPFVAELQNISDWQMIQVNAMDGCANVGVLDHTIPNVEDVFLNNAFLYTSNYDLGLTESLFRLGSMALEQTGPGQCNDGALRPGAFLHIIVASDEYEQSGTPWGDWVTEFQGYVSSPDYLKISGILDVDQDCGEGPGNYIDAINATGGSALDICTDTWGDQLTDIAAEVLSADKTFNLTELADPATIVVQVNGVITTDWVYTEGANSVTVNSPVVEEGDQVEVSYSVLAVCG